MIEVDPQNPCPALFRGAKSYRSQDSITAVRLEQPVAIVTLLGREVGQVGDYLTRDRKTGVASIVPKKLFEATYFVERETKSSQRGTVIA